MGNGLLLTINRNDHLLESLGPGAGIIKDLVRLEQALASSATEVTFGSTTPLPREGNVGGTTFYYNPVTHSSVNSVGLANWGFERGKLLVPAIIGLAKRYEKKVRMSLAAFSPEEFFTMTDELMVILKQWDGLEWIIIEINLGCPNTGHVVMAYSPALVGTIMRGVCARVAGRATVAFKLSPYDKTIATQVHARRDIRHTTALCAQGYQGLIELVLCNTYGGYQMLQPDGSPALGVMENVGGLAGKGLQPFTLENVDYFSTDLPDNVWLVGAGGVESGEDICWMLAAGRGRLTKVQSTSFPAEYGDKVFADMYRDIADSAEGA